MDDGDDSFEFFSLHRSPPVMCAADDVFLAGKILPFGAPPPPPPTRSTGTRRHQSPQENAADVVEAARSSRRFWVGRGGTDKANYRKLRSPASDADVATKSFPPPPHATAATATTAKQRPRWYLYVLGSMRMPATMDLSDIRSRQQRRRCPPVEATEPSVDGNRGTWKLLRSLSCKGVESAGVSATYVRDLQGV